MVNDLGSQKMVRLTGKQREEARHFIPLGGESENELLSVLGMSNHEELFSHIPEAFRFSEDLKLPDELSLAEVRNQMRILADKNDTGVSLIGDGLPDYEIHPIVSEICKIRELATAYTPYQPERSQGTLITQWIYQCGMSALTGFEAINASLYDRSTAIFEACLTAFRVSRKKSKVLVSSGLFPGDKEVLETHFNDTDNQLEWLPLNEKTGCLDLSRLKKKLESDGGSVAAVVFPQVNSLGLVEDFDDITRVCEELKCLTVGVIDPLHLVQGGLKRPSDWGNTGTDFVVGEAQHLAFNPCFGGPGLGIFGVRTEGTRKNFVRNTPGRYVGKATDRSDRDCFVAVMSAREQHIRKDRATSNICSNQAFIATLAGAAMLAYGNDGLKDKLLKARENAERGLRTLLKYQSFELAFPEKENVNEILLAFSGNAPEFIEQAAEASIHVGIDVSNRIKNADSLIKVSFHDREIDWSKLEEFLDSKFTKKTNCEDIRLLPIEESKRRSLSVALFKTDGQSVLDYYKKLGKLNLSPDNGIYPLGSCTMKYNPLINEWAAGLDGFQHIHPQAPVSSSQGCLEVLYETQEWFKAITGLAGVTTQPVAGAQGELVGIKLFQAYHKDLGQENRDIVFIPSTAHGTNFATAVMAGYVPGRMGKKDAGVVVLETDPLGGIDLEDFQSKLEIYGDRLVGIMITNPNTCGVFESNFRQIADRVHNAGGLVYMDGANMNAVAGWIDLDALGVDAVHNNIHKTWSIPHGGGGPGDGFVAVSKKLVDYLPGHQIVRKEDSFEPVRSKKSIGSFHRHWGNFNHKIRCLTYLKALGREGISRMSAVAVLCARYLSSQLMGSYEVVPSGSEETPRMHEFVMTFQKEIWDLAEKAGIQKTAVMPGLGKLFLDFGYHAPTVAFPEPYGVMIEPTESYSKAELDRFCEVALKIVDLIRKKPEVLEEAPYFTPIDRVNEVDANRNPVLSEELRNFPKLHPNRVDPIELIDKDPGELEGLLLSK